MRGVDDLYQWDDERSFSETDCFKPEPEGLSHNEREEVNAGFRPYRAITTATIRRRSLLSYLTCGLFQ